MLNSTKKVIVQYFIVGALALLTLMIWAHLFTPAETLASDGKDYFETALKIYHGQASRISPFGDTGIVCDPGYPNALSLFFLIAGPTLFAAQLFNGLLWAGSSMIGFSFLKKICDVRSAFGMAILFALSPMLTTFGAKVYSEHLAIFAAMILLWGVFQFLTQDLSPRQKWLRGLAVVFGVFIVVATKAAYFPLLILLMAFCLAMRKYRVIGVSLLVGLACVLPEHLVVQKGVRGLNHLAMQVTKADIQPYSLIARCGVYNLSKSLGEKLFPEVRGACTITGSVEGLPMAELSHQIGMARVEKGFGYKDAVRIIFSSPFKYFFVGLSTVTSAIWMDGFYPTALSRFSPTTQIFLWLFLKAGYSSLIWIGAIWAMVSILRKDPKQSIRRKVVLLFLIPIVYTFFFNMNISAEQRHFQPLLPLLYILCGISLERVISHFLKRQEPEALSVPTQDQIKTPAAIAP